MQGAEAVYQINTLLRSDPAVTKAFGRERCADQSTIQETLLACTSLNVLQMQEALSRIFGTNSRSSTHDYTEGPIILDIDITGLPCGRHLEGAEKGYFTGFKGGTTGCQLYRVSASQYDEIVYQQVCPVNIGSAQLSVFKQVVEATWQVLKLSAQSKGQVLIRLDSGYGTTDIINYLLVKAISSLPNSLRPAGLESWGAPWRSKSGIRTFAMLAGVAPTYNLLIPMRKENTNSRPRHRKNNRSGCGKLFKRPYRPYYRLQVADPGASGPGNVTGSRTACGVWTKN